MTAPLFIEHDHVPLYRVVRAGWPNPLDTTFSRTTGGRWNAPEAHEVLYACCSESVARSIVADILRIGALEIGDLRPEYWPVLAELHWTGLPIDLVSAEGIIAAGFSPEYPRGVEHGDTQPYGAVWAALGAEGVLCRSASVFRINREGWLGGHEEWSELAIFVENAGIRPGLLRVRPHSDWLETGTA